MSLTKDDLARLGPAAQRQIAAAKPAGKSKYHNQKDSRGPLVFDSKKEARRFDELMLMLKAGKIRNLKLQPQFTLQEAYTTTDGVRVRAIRYRADFSYEERPEIWDDWTFVVEDVKSNATKTRVYEMKKKLMREKFGIDVREV